MPRRRAQFPKPRNVSRSDTSMAVLSALVVGAYLLVRQPREFARMFNFPKLCGFIGTTSAFDRLVAEGVIEHGSSRKA